LGVAGAALLIGGCGGSSPEAAIEPPTASTMTTATGIAAEEPPHPEQLDVATRAQERRAHGPAINPVYSGKPQKAIKASDPGEMPAASAGSNGSYTPSDRHGSVSAQRTAGLDPEDTAILVGRTALAPPSAPEAVKAAISGANQIVGTPYVWGGGHGSWYSDGYDCSGAVSYALGAAGLLAAPLNSTSLENWGEPGPGKWITVYANSTHAYAVIAGLRWDTVGDARGTGPRWHAELPYPKGFVVRHPAGY
jgi:cell wall-associated NlpC family hydrolase